MEKFVLPMCLLNLMVARQVWRFLGDGWLRWVVCSAILRFAYVGMGQSELRRKRTSARRRYRYAE